MPVGTARSRGAMPLGCGLEGLEFGFGLDVAARELQQQAVGELVGAARAIQGLGDMQSSSLEYVLRL
jgi:hypothetical protein